MVKFYQVWYETSVGPCFSTKQKAIDWLNNDPDEPYNPDEDFPQIRELEVDTGYMNQSEYSTRQFLKR